MDDSLRRWYFEAEDFEENGYFLDENGDETDYGSAKDNPFIGTITQAQAEAERRSNLWGEKQDAFIAIVIHHSMGKVREALKDKS